MKRHAAVVCCLLLTAGCAHAEVGPPPGMPACTAAPDDRASDVMVLVAQSVPTARWLPCVRSLPVGWDYQRLIAQRGKAVIRLRAGDRDGEHRVTVELTAGCEVGQAGQVASERPELRRYERVTRATPGYLADRYYLFDGGCVTYHFDLQGRGGADAASAVTAGLDFVSRDAVAAAVSQRSHGRLSLDPGGAG